MKEITVDVIIPVYRPGERFGELLKRLDAQTQPVNRYIIMNTEQAYWDRWLSETGYSLPENLSVFHVTRETFDHGATRDAGIRQSDAGICVCMTDDALPADQYLLENLVRGLTEKEGTAVAYGRQLPDRDCGIIERYTRAFNYPEESRLKTREDLPELGIKTYFCSNVCAAYKRSVYLELGGFTKKTIFNEDMIFAAQAMERGYGVFYSAGARVIHSHNYNCTQQFKRNFDLAVSQTMHPEIFGGIRSESEGIRLVKRSLSYCIKIRKPWLMIQVVTQSAGKLLGYKLGQRYERLPRKLVLACTMNREFWDKEEL